MADDKKQKQIEEDIEPIIKYPKKAERVGIVVNITPLSITVDYKGTGESIPFKAALHSKVRVGDEIKI
jgi:hypothetical protein